jgi:disulfide bond formation protein DsbB
MPSPHQTPGIPGTPRRWLAGGALIATIATLGSLWLSLGLGLHPCELCWYQRILLYPLTVVLAVAAIDRRAAVARSVLPLALLGGAIAAYHSVLQLRATSCGLTGACGTVLWRAPVIGLSIPNLALIAFLGISLVVAVTYSTS